jgi:hypothetical protein
MAPRLLLRDCHRAEGKGGHKDHHREGRRALRREGRK